MSHILTTDMVLTGDFDALKARDKFSVYRSKKSWMEKVDHVRREAIQLEESIDRINENYEKQTKEHRRTIELYEKDIQDKEQELHKLEFIIRDLFSRLFDLHRQLNGGYSSSDDSFDPMALSFTSGFGFQRKLVPGIIAEFQSLKERKARLLRENEHLQKQKETLEARISDLGDSVRTLERLESEKEDQKEDVKNGIEQQKLDFKKQLEELERQQPYRIARELETQEREFEEREGVEFSEFCEKIEAAQGIKRRDFQTTSSRELKKRTDAIEEMEREITTLNEAIAKNEEEAEREMLEKFERMRASFAASRAKRESLAANRK